MPTKNGYFEFIIEQLSGLTDIRFCKMMGEYIIYYKDKIVAYVCDNRLLVKPVPIAFKIMKDAKLVPPYSGAKEMLLVDNVDDADFLKNLIINIELELPTVKRKNKQ